MADNPYAPPEAIVADVATPGSDAAQPVFFPVSLTKLVVLSFCTLGIYQLFWFYRNWRMIRDRTGENLLPVIRTIFAIFFCYPLFKRIRDYGPDLLSNPLPAGALATLWVVLSLLWNLPDPWGLVGFGTVFVLVQAQVAVNAINDAVAPTHDCNARFSGWNWLALGVGGPLFLIAVVGAFLPHR